MRFAVTGGHGFVGGSLISQLRSAGHAAEAFPRNSLSLNGFDVLIHGGWDFAAVDERNITRSKQLFEAAVEAKARIIFISSLSAFEGCRSFYGQTKLAVEKEAVSRGGCAVRLGFVCDETDRGLSGGLKKLAALPVVPLPGGGKQNLFAIYAGDLGAVFLKLVENCSHHVVSCAHPDPIPLQRLMQTFADRQNRKPVFLPVPWRALWFPLHIAEAVGLKLNFRSDSLVSLMNQNPAPDFRKLTEWRIQLHPFAEMLR